LTNFKKEEKGGTHLQYGDLKQLSVEANAWVLVHSTPANATNLQISTGTDRYEKC
jgi:hypothetical protein